MEQNKTKTKKNFPKLFFWGVIPTLKQHIVTVEMFCLSGSVGILSHSLQPGGSEEGEAKDEVSFGWVLVLVPVRTALAWEHGCRLSDGFGAGREELPVGIRQRRAVK